MRLLPLLLAPALLFASPHAEAASQVFDDSGWTVLYHEGFDSTFEAQNGQTYGQARWLRFDIHNGAGITIADGYAQIEAEDFWHAALIRSTHVLPEEYRIRTKVGYIEYDLTNYEQADYDNPAFNDHGGYYENGMYFLTITNDTCVGDECAEEWWHYHRKMVIDVDNHLNYGGGGETFHPIFMVYMDPAVNSGGNLLRTWNGAVWDSSAWNWNVAHTYDYDTWYYAELSKRDGHLTLRLYDASGVVIENPPPIAFEHVFAIDDSLEFLYVGEPHTDDYEGRVRIDDITLMIPATGCCSGLTGNVDSDAGGDVDLSDLIYLVNYIFLGGPTPLCMAAANVNGDGGCTLDLSDLIYLVNYVFLGGPAPAACLSACE